MEKRDNSRRNGSIMNGLEATLRAGLGALSFLGATPQALSQTPAQSISQSPSQSISEVYNPENKPVISIQVPTYNGIPQTMFAGREYHISVHLDASDGKIPNPVSSTSFIFALPNSDFDYNSFSLPSRQDDFWQGQYNGEYEMDSKFNFHGRNTNLGNEVKSSSFWTKKVDGNYPGEKEGNGELGGYNVVYRGEQDFKDNFEVFQFTARVTEGTPSKYESGERGQQGDFVIVSPEVEFRGPPSSFDEFVQGYFPGETSQNIISKQADPDRDGFSNFAEYALCQDPTREDEVVLRRGKDILSGDRILLLPYNQKDKNSMIEKIEVIPEYSHNLIEWFPVVGNTGFIRSEGNIEDNQYFQVFHYYNPAENNFLRLRIEEN